MDIKKKVAERRAELAEQQKELIREEKLARIEAKVIAKSKVAHINPKPGEAVENASTPDSETKTTQRHIDMAIEKEVNDLASSRMTASESRIVAIFGLGGLVTMFFAFPIGLVMFFIGMIYFYVVRSKYKEKVQYELDNVPSDADTNGSD
ncbi:MAG: hypothetical protein ACI9KA_001073 [Parasphingorhabdus sp.]|jgi:hypothetical protein|uniref:hypothetical protein n=1 Tax=Parasphingorhabdus sp. TaxID=2709688 RepID=UPI0039E436F0